MWPIMMYKSMKLQRWHVTNHYVCKSMKVQRLGLAWLPNDWLHLCVWQRASVVFLPCTAAKWSTNKSTLSTQSWYRFHLPHFSGDSTQEFAQTPATHLSWGPHRLRTVRSHWLQRHQHLMDIIISCYHTTLCQLAWREGHHTYVQYIDTCCPAQLAVSYFRLTISQPNEATSKS